MAKTICIGSLIVLILFALISIVPDNLNQRQRGEEPTFSMEQMIVITIGGIVMMGILATIATGGHREGNG